MKDQEEILYEEVFLALNGVGVNYAVCGGLVVGEKEKDEDEKFFHFYNHD